MNVERIVTGDRFPETVDINITGSCNLKCTFCWGPSHETDDVISLYGWRQVLQNIAYAGTKSIVITGGEPLIREDAVDILRFAKSLGLGTTLSTNGMFHSKLQEALPYIDRVGIPLDGSTPQQNERMRILGRRHFDLACGAMKLVKTRQPNTYLTARTVISNTNYDDLENIGRLLETGSFNVDRWKLYEFTPTGGYGGMHRDEHQIEHGLYMEKLNKLNTMFPALRVTGLKQKERGGRYLFVMPNGDASKVDVEGATYIHLGNVLSDFQAVVSALHVLPQAE